MDKLWVKGGSALKGIVQVAGAKNAALPCMMAPILTTEKCTLSRVPNLSDIETTKSLLNQMGVQIENNVEITAENVNSFEAPYDLVRKMRASVIVLGPLLARFGKAKVSLPGGCAIGNRPIDIHLKGFEKLGAEIELSQGYVTAKTKGKRLLGTKLDLEFPSVGATENLMLASVTAKGSTRISNAAREPEISDLAKMLRAMGAKISGEGSSDIEIEGVDALHGCKHEIVGDRIEAGTYLSAGIACGGEVTVKGAEPEHLSAVLEVFERMGAKVETDARAKSITVSRDPSVAIRPTDFVTAPFPGFPTDMQAQVMAVLCLASGQSHITETIFENRFMHVPELARLGAKIKTEGNRATVTGTDKFIGAPLMATDLRASASLIIAALVAQGESVIQRIYHLDRGYEDLEGKLASLGAQVRRLK